WALTETFSTGRFCSFSTTPFIWAVWALTMPVMDESKKTNRTFFKIFFLINNNGLFKCTIISDTVLNFQTQSIGSRCIFFIAQFMNEFPGFIIVIKEHPLLIEVPFIAADSG